MIARWNIQIARHTTGAKGCYFLAVFKNISSMLLNNLLKLSSNTFTSLWHVYNNTVKSTNDVCDYWLCFYRDWAIDPVWNHSDSCAAQLCWASQPWDHFRNIFRFKSACNNPMSRLKSLPPKSSPHKDRRSEKSDQKRPLTNGHIWTSHCSGLTGKIWFVLKSYT